MYVVVLVRVLKPKDAAQYVILGWSDSQLDGKWRWRRVSDQRTIKINKPLNPFTHSRVYNCSVRRDNISLLSDNYAVKALWNAGLIFPNAKAKQSRGIFTSNSPCFDFFYTLHLYIAHWVDLSPSILLINVLIIIISFLMYVVDVIQEMTHINECSELWSLEMRTLNTVALAFDGVSKAVLTWGPQQTFKRTVQGLQELPCH